MIKKTHTDKKKKMYIDILTVSVINFTYYSIWNCLI